MKKDQTYIGIDNDEFGGMTTIGGIIKDAWVFGILPETETGGGWNLSQIQIVMDKVNAEWDKYGHLVSLLPEDIRQRHERIHGEALRKARAQGWTPEWMNGAE